jgi:hypothetical protein
LIGVVPAQAPVVAVSVWPSWAVPDTVGYEVTAGGMGRTTRRVPRANTTRVRWEAARPEPAAFLALTVTRSVMPMSRLDGVYRDLVAPAIHLHFLRPAGQRCQRYL